MNKFTAAGLALAASTALALSGCASNEADKPSTPASGGTTAAGGNMSGTLTGKGASTQAVAQTTWGAAFQQAHPSVTVNYDPVGSGAGVEAFIGGGADWAGSDKALSDDQIKGTFGKCAAGSSALDIPSYISPIAVVYNVPGVDKLNLNAEVTAKMFSGAITKWNDPAIAALNAGVTLPDTAITAVHRSDKSGTTNNFTDWLNQVAPSAWNHPAAEEWPMTTGEAAKGTSGVVAAVKNGSGAIGYADASQVTGMTVANIGENGSYSPPSAEAASKIVSAAPVVAGRAPNDLALKLDRKAAGYPVVLVSYSIVCAQYKDAATADLVKGYLSYAISPEGQSAAAAKAGNAPLSGELATKVKTAVDAIK